MKLTHIKDNGDLTMVDITDKKISKRTATASGFIKIEPASLRLIERNLISKGNVLTCAKTAGLLASKKVDELLPLTHKINLTCCDINFRYSKKPSGVEITATAKARYSTGVEMEALTAVAVAALTIYDMVKSADKSMTITNIKLLEKIGGKGSRQEIVNKR